MQDAPVTNLQLRAYMETYSHQPYGRFEQEPNGFYRLTHMGASEEELKRIPVTVAADRPIPLGLVIRVVPEAKEFQGRFEDYEAGIRQVFLRDDHPVVHVNYFEAAAFAASIGGRLPTDDEWEYAARAGREGDDVFATDDGTLKADNAQWSHPERPKEATSPVRSYRPNPFGLYDMTGQVWEWVSRPGYVQGLRGGSWLNDDPESLRVGCRDSDGSPGSRSSVVGFRVVSAASPEDSK